MKITYLAHATLLIELDGLKIITDPWLKGPCYTEQWYHFPKPIDNYESYLQDIDYVLISHGHEDHLHLETLKLINKSAHVFFPYTWFTGAKELFGKLGFQHFTEAVNETIYSLSQSVQLTFLANNLDNLMLIEGKDTTLVNINDSLPASPKSVIQYFCEKIKKKCAQIDYVLCSHAGASYYPNTIKCDWKDDVAVGTIRELFFVNNFCTIVDTLNPKYALPCGSDFVLLDEEQQWMNTVRFPRHQMEQYFKTYFPNSQTQILESYPGDQIEKGKVQINSTFHNAIRTHSVDELVKTYYQDEILKKKNRPFISNEDWTTLYHQVQKHIRTKYTIIPLELRNGFLFQIQITDFAPIRYIVVDFSQQEVAFSVTEQLLPDSKLLVKIRSEILKKSITKEWGGDSIVIGYGCEIQVYDKTTLEQQLDNWAVHVLSQYPNTKSYAKKNPLRVFKYLFNDEFKRILFFNKVLKRKSDYAFFDPILKDADLWFNRTNCEICKKCNLPVLDEALAQSLN